MAAAVPALGWGAGPSSRSAGVLPGPAADLLRQQIAALARPPWLQTAPGLRCLHNPSTAATQPRQAAAAPAWHQPRSTPPTPRGSGDAGFAAVPTRRDRRHRRPFAADPVRKLEVLSSRAACGHQRPAPNLRAPQNPPQPPSGCAEPAMLGASSWLSVLPGPEHVARCPCPPLNLGGRPVPSPSLAPSQGTAAAPWGDARHVARGATECFVRSCFPPTPSLLSGAGALWGPGFWGVLTTRDPACSRVPLAEQSQRWGWWLRPPQASPGCQLCSCSPVPARTKPELPAQIFPFPRHWEKDPSP